MHAERSNAADRPAVSRSSANDGSQRLRLRRFAMSVATYAVAILATFLITHLGIGGLTAPQWAKLVSLSLFGILMFFLLFHTGANLRFSEPSLTREQIVYSFLYALLVMYWLPEARPIVLLFFLPPFSFGVLSLRQRQYLAVVVVVMGLYAGLLGLEYLQSPPAFDLKYQLFLFILYGILLTWFAFFGGFVSKIRRRLKAQKEEIKREIEERKRAQVEKDKLIVELKDALSEVNTLSGLLPICAACKNIRDDNGYWNQLESYLKLHSQVEFSHGLCPDCAKKLYPDIDLNNKLG